MIWSERQMTQDMKLTWSQNDAYPVEYWPYPYLTWLARPSSTLGELTIIKIKKHKAVSMALTTSEYKAMTDRTSASALSRKPFRACKRHEIYLYYLFFFSLHQLLCSLCWYKPIHTLRKPTEIAPSFSDAASSCSTFSRPLFTACISSATSFNWTCQVNSTSIAKFSIYFQNLDNFF